MTQQLRLAALAVSAALSFNAQAQNAPAPNDAQIAAIVVTANQVDVDLVTRLKVKPQDNPTAQGLQKGGDDNLAKLRPLDGAAFDKSYVDHEVAYHVAVLDALDKVLIPSASNAELKALLVKVRPAIDAHLQHAKHLQAELGASGG